MYSKKQLDNSTKGVIIDITLQLQEKLEAIANAPTTPEAVKAVLLNIKKEVILSKERTLNSKQAHKERLAEIESNSKLAIAKANLEHIGIAEEDMKSILVEYNAMEEKVAKAKSDLSFGLEEATNDSKIDLDKIKDQVSLAKDSHKEDIEKYAEIISELKSSTSNKVSNMNIAHSRNVESIEYDQKIALRDLDGKFIESVCKKSNQTLIDNDELSDLKNVKPTDDKVVEDAVNVAVNAAKSAVHASEGAKYNALKSTSENTAAIDKNNIKNFEANAKSDALRIKDLEDRLKLVPEQIAKAVESAKSSIAVNQDAGKK